MTLNNNYYAFNTVFTAFFFLQDPAFRRIGHYYLLLCLPLLLFFIVVVILLLRVNLYPLYSFGSVFCIFIRRVFMWSILQVCLVFVDLFVFFDNHVLEFYSSFFQQTCLYDYPTRRMRDISGRARVYLLTWPQRARRPSSFQGPSVTSETNAVDWEP